MHACTIQELCCAPDIHQSLFPSTPRNPHMMISTFPCTPCLVKRIHSLATPVLAGDCVSAHGFVQDYLLWLEDRYYRSFNPCKCRKPYQHQTLVGRHIQRHAGAPPSAEVFSVSYFYYPTRFDFSSPSAMLRKVVQNKPQPLDPWLWTNYAAQRNSSAEG